MQYLGSYDENGNLDIDKLKEELEKIPGKVTVTETEEGLSVTVNGFKFTIEADGTIESVNGIYLSQTTLKKIEGEDPVTLTATMTEGISGTIIWSSSNKSVATVDNGTITLVAPGTADIIAKVKGTHYSAKCTVTIVSKVKEISADNLEIETNEEKTIKLTTNPSSNVEDLTYTYQVIEGNSYARVDNNGKVRGLAVGTSKIRITGTGKNGTNVTTECTVTVKSSIIKINTSPDNRMTTELKIDISYKYNGIKQYKIGESNKTWSTYTDTITLTSDTVISKGWGNSDKTVTIYAKGTNIEGNEEIVTQKLQTLDIDAPAAPSIVFDYGYPLLTGSGVVASDDKARITYDTRNDITNLYSIDNGQTWQNYTGTITNIGNGTVIAKSVKSSGLETMVSKTIGEVSDALEQKAYDGDLTTYAPGGGAKSVYANVDESAWGKTIKLSYLTGYHGVTFFNKNGSILFTQDSRSDIVTSVVPQNSTRLRLYFNEGGGLYEIEVQD